IKDDIVTRYNRIRKKILTAQRGNALNHVYTGSYLEGMKWRIIGPDNNGNLRGEIYNTAPTAIFMEFGKRQEVHMKELYRWFTTRFPGSEYWPGVWSIVRTIQTNIMTEGIKTAPRFFMQMEEQWKYRGAIDVEMYGLWIARNFNEENAPFLGKSRLNAQR